MTSYIEVMEITQGTPGRMVTLRLAGVPGAVVAPAEGLRFCQFSREAAGDPQPGDVWKDSTGVRWFCVNGPNGLELFREDWADKGVRDVIPASAAGLTLEWRRDG